MTAASVDRGGAWKSKLQEKYGVIFIQNFRVLNQIFSQRIQLILSGFSKEDLIIIICVIFVFVCMCVCVCVSVCVCKSVCETVCIHLPSHRRTNTHIYILMKIPGTSYICSFGLLHFHHTFKYTPMYLWNRYFQVCFRQSR